METLARLIRSRRTHKAFGRDPVPRQTLDELLELARWAPNHHRTNPWRFRVLGPETLARLKEAAGPAEAPKLERAPTLILASCVLSGDLQQDEELPDGENRRAVRLHDFIADVKHRDEHDDVGDWLP